VNVPTHARGVFPTDAELVSDQEIYLRPVVADRDWNTSPAGTCTQCGQNDSTLWWLTGDLDATGYPSDAMCRRCRNDHAFGRTAFLGPGGTATFTATRATDGGTVFALTGLSAAPFRYAPRRLLVTETGGTTFLVAGSASSGVLDPTGIPCADTLNVAVTGAGSSLSGTVFMYYDRWA